MSTQKQPTRALADVLKTIGMQELHKMEEQAKRLLENPNWVYRQENIATAYSYRKNRQSNTTVLP